MHRTTYWVRLTLWLKRSPVQSSIAVHWTVVMSSHCCSINHAWCCTSPWDGALFLLVGCAVAWCCTVPSCWLCSCLVLPNPIVWFSWIVRRFLTLLSKTNSYQVDYQYHCWSQMEQAGANLCQAQGKLVWLDLSLKFSWSCSLVYFSWRTDGWMDGPIEVIIMLSQLLDVVVVQAGWRWAWQFSDNYCQAQNLPILAKILCKGKLPYT